MEFNKESMKGKWREIKGEVQKAWGRLTDDELEATKGDFNSIGGLIQQKYGNKKEEVEGQLGRIYDRFKQIKDETAEDVKSSLRDNQRDDH